ncbi:death-on-curing family protein [Xylanimonas cellulosilytica DSM 15894]|uniref:Death-on-curing family protein n=1 Tax=Xylanimonas cellulosilytica (strain DSM 15894 / JCM 12276 / CECT 5975 / KCTC 9989 / LMG 20990 / NBRC 107835 / XIL07) TaxID=446471 RepID=D1BUQ1_XYLCX|nr:type II toxin-antitoxin system death-on-curing family toxin [Xylanimonas cellulosilytica]ACZ29292.1 death-on-curing family protein [Xylanimonas cellulosilytica DSM 15894]
MKRLTQGLVLALHQQMLAAHGGSEGVRDESLLDAALEAPYAAFAGREFFPTIEEKAARLGFGIVANHPFVDGNKRTGIMALLVLLDLNGVTVSTNNAELISLGLGLASGEITYEQTVRWVRERAGV